MNEKSLASRIDRFLANFLDGLTLLTVFVSAAHPSRLIGIDLVKIIQPFVRTCQEQKDSILESRQNLKKK